MIGMQREEVIKQLRQVLPGKSATAQAIDRQEPWDQLATTAVTDGYIRVAEEFDGFLAVTLWRRI